MRKERMERRKVEAMEVKGTAAEARGPVMLRYGVGKGHPENSGWRMGLELALRGSELDLIPRAGSSHFPATVSHDRLPKWGLAVRVCCGGKQKGKELECLAIDGSFRYP